LNANTITTVERGVIARISTTMKIKCEQCNGTGSILARNGINFTFSPGLASTMASRCPRCDGLGVRYIEPEDDYADRAIRAQTV
jgi:DnaJ-class molecular chaperone